MLGGADNPNGELPSYITGADKSSGELTDLRKRTLISLCTAITRNASLKAASRKDYYLRACLVEYAGVENLHVLCTSGLLPGVITDETGQRF